MFLQADSEDSDQTGRMPRLIWVLAGRTGHFVGFVVRRLMFVCGRCLDVSVSSIFEPRHEKTCLWGLRPGKTQTGLLSYSDYLESWIFGFSKYTYLLYYLFNEQQRRWCAGWSVPLLFAYGKNRFSRDVAHLTLSVGNISSWSLSSHETFRLLLHALYPNHTEIILYFGIEKCLLNYKNSDLALSHIPGAKTCGPRSRWQMFVYMSV